MGSPRSRDATVVVPARFTDEPPSQSPHRIVAVAKPPLIVAEQEALRSHSAGGQCVQGLSGVPRHDAASVGGIGWVELCIAGIEWPAVR